MRALALLGLTLTLLYAESSSADDKNETPLQPVLSLRPGPGPARAMPAPTFADIMTEASRTQVDRSTFSSRTLPLGNLNPTQLHAVREYLGASFNNSEADLAKTKAYLKNNGTGERPGADAETAAQRRVLNGENPQVPKGTTYSQMNGQLRGGSKAPTDPVQAAYVKEVNAALDDAFTKQRTKAPLVTYRFTGDGAYNKPDANGYLPPDKGYTSTARIPALEFAKPGKVLIVYYLPEGTPALNMEAMLAKTGDAALYEARIRASSDQNASGFGRDEVLLPREMKMRVITTYTDPSGQKIMHVQVEAPNGPTPPLPSQLAGESPTGLRALLDAKLAGPGRATACETRKAPMLPGAQPPRTGWTVAKGAPLALGATALGKGVEKLTGSPEAGMATGIGVGMAPALKYGIKGGLKAGVPVVIGLGAQYGTTKLTGSKDAGEVAGYLTSAATGAKVGGPWGAVAGVTIHGASNMLGAGIDVLEAQSDSKTIDLAIAKTGYQRVFGAPPSRDELSKYYDMLRNGKGPYAVREEMVNSDAANALIDAYFKRELGRPPQNDEERNAARDVLRGPGAAVLAAALAATPHAAAYRAELAQKAEWKRIADAAYDTEKARIESLHFHNGQLADVRKSMNRTIDLLKTTKAAPGTPEHDALVYAIGEDLKMVRFFEDVVDELKATHTDILTGTSFKEPAGENPAWREVRDLRDQAFASYYQQSRDRLMQGEWGKQIDAYTSGYKGDPDPIRRAATSYRRLPFETKSEQYKLEEAFGRVGESPKEYEANAARWKQEKADMLRRKEEGIPVTSTATILESLGRPVSTNK